jgi:hypothetical protein
VERSGEKKEKSALENVAASRRKAVHRQRRSVQNSVFDALQINGTGDEWQKSGYMNSPEN